mmetsp:Transcript_53735/g.126564  ORF Transcript_53735/g.126564 Transcript_53735/m.126564 type:complete len:234 (-) Transcript_53735:258-959(-)
MGPLHAALGALAAQLFLRQAGHDDGQLVRRQRVGVVQHAGHRQVLAAHGAVDDDLQALDGREHIDRAPVAAGAVVVQHEVQRPAHSISSALRRFMILMTWRRVSARNSGRSTGVSLQMPALSPAPVSPKKSRIVSKRAWFAMAPLMTWASEPAPAGPINGRAEIRLVKYSAGRPRCLQACTSGVVPMASCGRWRSTAARSCSSDARYCTSQPCASSQTRSGSDHGVRGQAVPT